MWGFTVHLSDIKVYNLEKLGDMTHRAELVNAAGNTTGIHIYGRQVAEKLDDLMLDNRLMATRYRNLNYWQPTTVDDIRQLVEELGYLIIGDGMSYRRILLISDSNQAVDIWREAQKVAFEERVEEFCNAVVTADTETDVPF